MQKQKPQHQSNQQGQSMVEYALIVALVILAFAVAIAATGPAIGNVFSNTVYNLLGTDPDDINDLPDKEAFWLTVTWISQQTPEENPLPTRTKVPPTEIPTDGPSPTPSPTVPTDTPVPTFTPTPSPTPRDFEFFAPWDDSADLVDHWRLGGDVYLGSDEGWYAEYFSDRSLTTSTLGEYTSVIDESKKYNLNFNWGNGSPIDDWPSAGDEGNNFGISFRRQIYVENEMTLLFKLKFIDDGVRVWLLDGHGDITTTRPGNCSATGVTWGGDPNSSPGGLRLYDDDHPTYSDDCLIMDGWRGVYGSTATVRRTVPAGFYTVVVDFNEGGGGAGIELDIDSGDFTGNPDDREVDSSGAVVSDSADCRWGSVTDEVDSNSLENRWDAWETSPHNFAVGNRCYLELRGSVEIPAGMIDPVLSFWDVWDLRDPNMEAWVEVAEYDPDNDGVFERDSLVWVKQSLHVGSTTNYNWSYQEIDLRSLLGLSGADTMEDKKYTFRFGMEVRSASYTVGTDNGYRLWWIDSIEVNEAPKKTFYTAQLWDLDSPEQAEDFITSGRWELTSANTRGGTGLSWEDSPPGDYARTALDGCGSGSSGCTDYSNQNLRMHTIEFNGIVDLNDPLGVSDLEGDSGDAILSFWHSYDIDRRTGLEIQYTTDLDYDSGEAPNWQVVPEGQINNRNSSSRPELDSLTFTEVNLEELKTLEPAANGRFRIRFAMTVHRQSETDPGWWIDDIQLERDAISNFMRYPYIETFEEEHTINDWLLGGNWGRVDNRAWRPVSGTGHSITDSPYTRNSDGSIQQETFNTNQTTTVDIRLAFDINNDSPLNPYSNNCQLVPSTLCEDPNPVPDDPIMTFQWWHDFGSSGGEHFYVEWKKADDSDANWQELWAYRDRMSFNSSGDSSTRRQWNWQRVEIDLRAITSSGDFNNGLPDSETDDDIIFRFRFTTNGNNNGADGVYIDEIHIEERNERTFAFWEEGVSADVENPSFPSTDPLLYTTDSFRYVRLVADSEVNGNNWATVAEFNLLDKDGTPIPRDDWEVESFSSERADNLDFADNMLDGDPDTEWFTQINPTTETHPHEFVIDLDASYQVGFFQILPRQLDPSNSYWQNGWIHEYRFYVSQNGSDWELAKDSQLAVTQSEQTVALQIDYSTDTPPAGGDGTTTVEGGGIVYRDNLDDRANELFDNWYLGGNWEVIDWEQHDGVLAFHDSTIAPLNSSEDPETPPPNTSNYTKQSSRTFNILEMSTIIDMRATQSNRNPILTFWQRHQVGSSNYLRVQIAYEDPDTIGTSSHCFTIARDQCYEHLYGWSKWETAPPWNQGGYNDWDRAGTTRQYLWKREIVDLSPYAATADAPGKRIRLRFVSDSMDRGTSSSDLNQLLDGWYIDNIEFKYNIPTVVNIDADTSDSFFDGARNTRNWITEGTWGLSPEFFRGSGGGPADFGGQFWNYWMYNMGSCPTGNTSFTNCVGDRFDDWDDPAGGDGSAYLVQSGLALDINNDWGSGGPGGLNSRFGGIWELTTPVIGTTMNAGNYTFVFTYDEALRVKFDTVPAGNIPSTAELPNPYSPEWNIYNDFMTGGRQVNVGNALFESGKQYKIRMEYFDRWGDATFIMSLGSSSFSFTDSPKQASGAAFPEIPAAPRAVSSLIFNGVFDLRDAIEPIVFYYTYHELGGTARVEVTTDGGFIWTETGLQGATPPSFWTSDWVADYWNDETRSNNEKMAYVSSGASASGNPEFNTTAYPPEQTEVYAIPDLNLNWGSNSPVPGWTRPNGQSVRDNWSAQFRRSFTLPTDREVTFRVRSDDGHRLWLNLNGTGYFPMCAFLDNDPSKPLVSGQPRVSGEDDETIGGLSGSCLLISDWENSGGNDKTVTRTIPAGNHELILDFYDATGNAWVNLEVRAGDYDDPSYGGTWMPYNGDWREKVHTLEAYAGYELDGDPKPPVGLRFRLDRAGIDEGSNYQQNSTQSPTDWMESWWITDISVIDTTSG